MLGASGFIGRGLTKELLSNGFLVYGTFYKNKDRVINGCIALDYKQLEQENFDIIFIAVGNYSLSKEANNKLLAVLNQVLSFHVNSKIILISSAQVESETRNDNEVQLKSDYVEAKKKQEDLVVSLCKNYIILRPTYIYGSGMSSNSLIPKWTKSALRNSSIEVYGSGNRYQDYLYIDDLVSCCLQAIKYTENDSFIIASGKSYKNLTLAYMFKEFFPDIIISFKTAQEGPSYVYDISRTENLLNWNSKVDLSIGLSKYINSAHSYL